MTDEAEKLRAQGLDVETVGDIIGDGEARPPLARFEPPRLEGVTPPFPQPGIYFGMSDEEYHAIPALSASGIKALAASPMLFWAKSWLNPEKEEEEKEHLTLGKAYHCRILEGAAAFEQRFCIGLDRKDYPGCLESTDEIKAAIGKFEAEDFDKKTGASKGMVPIKPVSKVPDVMPDGVTEYMRAAVKKDWIAQLLELDPEAKVWAVIEREFADANAGKQFITAEQYKRLAIAARMIEGDAELSKAFTGGYPEVALFYYCPKTGVPMKLKADYLKVRALVDLKTVANSQEMSIERAIAREIANRKYNIQPSVYFEGAGVVRDLVRKHGASVIFSCGEEKPREEHVNFAMKWAKHQEPDEWLWVFQQKGIAPITRGVFYPRGGTTKMVSDDIVSMAKKRFREFADSYGVEPWLDLAPIYNIADEDIPQWSTDI